MYGCICYLFVKYIGVVVKILLILFLLTGCVDGHTERHVKQGYKYKIYTNSKYGQWCKDYTINGGVIEFIDSKGRLNKANTYRVVKY